MEYCDECNSLMVPKKEGDESCLVCRNCGNKKKANDDDFKVSKKQEKDPKGKVVVMDEETRKNSDSLPVTEKQCPECGHDKAGWWTQQTRSGDEAPTRFYICKECGHKWREYD